MYKRNKIISSVAACALFGAAHAASPDNAISLARNQANTDAATTAQMANLMQQWNAAVIDFAQTIASDIPWNQNQSTAGIQYAPLLLYAGPTASAPSPAACGFSTLTATGQALPTAMGINLSQPVNLAGLSVNMGAGTSQQAAAYAQATGTQPVKFFPSGVGSPLGGTYCAAVQFTFTGQNTTSNTTNQTATIATWYVPSAGQTPVNGGSSLPQNLVFNAAQTFANQIASTGQGGSVTPLYTNANNTANWNALTASKSSQFMQLLSNIFSGGR